MLEVKNLTVQMGNGSPILSDISIVLQVGECVGLTGASGSGKTTLLKTIMGMQSEDLAAAQGQIFLAGQDILGCTQKQRRQLCGKVIGFIPQNPMTAFFPHVRIGKQMVETLQLHVGVGRRAAQILAEDILAKVNLMDTMRVMEAYPGELSGGMLQRIAMALILGTNPPYILADEPTSALDEVNRNLLLDLLIDCRKNAAVLLISHDAEAMKVLCSSTYVIEQGKIIEMQETAKLFLNPQQPWTKSFAQAAGQHEEMNWQWTVLN